MLFPNANGVPERDDTRKAGQAIWPAIS